MKERKERGPRANYEPTPAEIRKACEQIQAGWSPRERRKRAGKIPDSTWTAPIIHFDDTDETTNYDLGNDSSGDSSYDA